MTSDEKPSTGISTGSWLGIIAATFIFALIGWAYIEPLSSPKPVASRAMTRASDATPGRYQVTYRITGHQGSAEGASASLTYTNESGGTEQQSVSLPWEKSFIGKSGAFVYISAQNAKEYGTVNCEILIDGRAVKESRSEGPFVIASCSGRI